MDNPKHAIVQPLQGRQLPPNWQAVAMARGTAADADYQHWLENAWRQGPGAAKEVASPTRDARLNHDRADGSDSGPQMRLDGQLLLVEDRADGLQLWRDTLTGAAVWRHLEWHDMLGKK